MFSPMNPPSHVPVPDKNAETNQPMDGSKGLNSSNRAMREEILHRARTIWEQRGEPQGEDLSIWLQAESEVINGKTA